MNGELLTWDVWGNPQIIEQDEYLFTDDMTELEIKGYLDSGWKLKENILTKDIY